MATVDSKISNNPLGRCRNASMYLWDCCCGVAICLGVSGVVCGDVSGKETFAPLTVEVAVVVSAGEGIIWGASSNKLDENVSCSGICDSKSGELST